MVAGAEPALSQWTSRTADDSWFSTQLANRGGDSKNPMGSGDPADSKNESSVCWVAGLEDHDRGRRSTSRGGGSSTGVAIISDGWFRFDRSRGETVVTVGDELLAATPREVSKPEGMSRAVAIRKIHPSAGDPVVRDHE